MKKLFFVFTILLVFFFATNSMAFLNNHNNKGGDAEANAKATAVGVGVGIGMGGDAVAINNIRNSNKSTVLNLVDVDNEIHTDFKQNQKQSQRQGQAQLQGQLQGQRQGQTAHNEGVVQEITINEAEVPPDHIQPGEGHQPDVKILRTRQFAAKTFGGDILSRRGYLNIEEAKSLADSSPDAEVIEDVFVKRGYETNVISSGKSGEWMGYLVVVVDGPDLTASGVEGKAAVAAMKLGATHMIEVFARNGERVDGKAWSIGFGAGASVAAADGKTVIAPGGGTGYGKADSITEDLPERVYEIYSNEAILKK